jgi:hypothetical protein
MASSLADFWMAIYPAGIKPAGPAGKRAALALQKKSAVILRCSPPSASLEGWPHTRLWPSFETPRKSAAPLTTTA